MLAQDIMTKTVATVGPDATIDAVIAVMVALHASGVPVVAQDGTLAGIITEGDLLRRVETATDGPRPRSFLDILFGSGREAADYVRSHSRRVSDLMTAPVISVTEETPLVDLVHVMENKRIRRVPVLRDGRLVGIVSRADLVRALGRRLAELPKPAIPATDDALAQEVRAALGRVSLFDNCSVGVEVENGVATVEGVIHDERLRSAIRVTVETIPGIRSVTDRITFVEPMTGSIYPA